MFFEEDFEDTQNQAQLKKNPDQSNSLPLSVQGTYTITQENKHSASDYIPFDMLISSEGSSILSIPPRAQVPNLPQVDLTELPVFEIKKTEIDFEGDVQGEWHPSELLQSVPYIPADSITLHRKLGSGAFGVVYLGSYQGRFVALKELNVSHAKKQMPFLFEKGIQQGTQNLHEAFEWEVLGSLGLEDESIVRSLAIYRTKDKKGQPRCGMVMDFCNQGSLESIVEKLHTQGKRLSHARIWRLALQIAKGLHYLHGKGRIHRDLKTENVLVHQLRAMLADLGVAQQDVLLHPGNEAYVVQLGLKDFQWMSPEEFLGHPATAASDIYSFGLILWHLLTGKKPYEGYLDTPEFACDVIAKQAFRETVPDYCPRGLKTLIEACWDPDPKKRPTIESIISRLEALGSDLDPDAAAFLLELRTGSMLSEYRSKMKEYRSPYVTAYPVEEDFDKYWLRREKQVFATPSPSLETKQVEMKEVERRLFSAAPQSPQLLENEFNHFLSAPQVQMLALSGGQELGKSLAMYYWVDVLLENYRTSTVKVSNQQQVAWFPVLLPAGVNISSQEDLEKVFQPMVQGLAGEASPLRKMRLLFVVDDYSGELNTDVLKAWPQAKMVVTSQQKIAPSSNPRVMVRYLLPFRIDQVFGYLQHHLGWDTVTRHHYEQSVSDAPKLRAVLRYPSVLTRFAQGFEVISKKELKTLTRADIYLSGVEHWLNTKKTLLPATVLAKLQGTAESLLDSFYVSASKVAFACHQANRSMMEQSLLLKTLAPQAQTWLQLDQWVAEAAEAEFNACRQRLTEQERRRALLSLQDYTRILQLSANEFMKQGPMSVHEGLVGFGDKSYLDNFTAHFMQSVCDSGDPQTLKQALVTRSLQTAPGVMVSLVERLSVFIPVNETRKKKLLEQLLSCKHHPELSTLADNAITLLCHLGVVFSDGDLDDLPVREANITRGIFDSAKIRRTDLSKVKMGKVWMRNADLTDSLMPDIQTGEHPYLEISEKIITCYPTTDGRWLAVAEEKNDVISVTEVASKKLLGRFKFPDGGRGQRETGLAINPEGTLLVLLIHHYKHQVVELWNLITGKQKTSFGIPKTKGAVEDTIFSIALSHHGKYIALVGRQFIYLRNSEGQFLHKIEKPIETHQSVVTFSPDDTQLIELSRNSDIEYRIDTWDVTSGQHLRVITEKPAKKEALEAFGILTSGGISEKIAMSSDGEYLAYSTGDSTVQLWLVKNAASILLCSSDGSMFSDMAFTPDNRYLAIAFDKTVTVWEVDTGECVTTLEGHLKTIKSIGFTRTKTGLQLVSASSDGSLRFWDEENWTTDQLNKPTPQQVKRAVLSADGQWLAIVNKGRVELRATTTWQVLKSIDIDRWEITDIIFSPDSRYLAMSGKFAPVVSVFDVTEFVAHGNTVVRTFAGDYHLEPSNGLAVFMEYEERNNVVSQKGVGSGHYVFQGVSHYLASMRASFGESDISPGYFIDSMFMSNTHLIVGNSDGSCHVWNLNNNEKFECNSSCHSTTVYQPMTSSSKQLQSSLHPPQPRFNISGLRMSVQLSADAHGRRLAMLGKDVVLLNPNHPVAPGEVLSRDETTRAISMSADGRYLAEARGLVMVLWDLQTKKTICTSEPQGGTVTSLSFSPDNRYIAFSLFGGKRIYLCDATTLERVQIISGCRGEILNMSWSQNSQGVFLVTASSDHAARYWQVIPALPAPRVILRWSSYQEAFVADGAELLQVKGLSSENATLLIQQGASDDKTVWFRKAEQCEGLRQFSQAVAYYDKALAIDPNDKESLAKKGVALSELGRYAEAVVCYDRVIALDEQFADENAILTAKGSAYFYSNTLDKALTCFDKVLKKDDGTAMRTPCYKGYILLLQKNPKAVEKLFDQVLAKNANFHLALLGKGFVAWCNSQRELAQRYFQQAEQACSSLESKIECSLAQGKLLSGLGFKKEAQVAFEKGLKLDPHYAPLLQAVAIINQEQPDALPEEKREHKQETPAAVVTKPLSPQFVSPAALSVIPATQESKRDVPILESKVFIDKDKVEVSINLTHLPAYLDDIKILTDATILYLGEKATAHRQKIEDFFRKYIDRCPFGGVKKLLDKLGFQEFFQEHLADISISTGLFVQTGTFHRYLTTDKTVEGLLEVLISTYKRTLTQKFRCLEFIEGIRFPCNALIELTIRMVAVHFTDKAPLLCYYYDRFVEKTYNINKKERNNCLLFALTINLVLCRLYELKGVPKAKYPSDAYREQSRVMMRWFINAFGDKHERKYQEVHIAFKKLIAASPVLTQAMNKVAVNALFDPQEPIPSITSLNTKEVTLQLDDFPLSMQPVQSTVPKDAALQNRSQLTTQKHPLYSTPPTVVSSAIAGAQKNQGADIQQGTPTSSHVTTSPRG